MDDIVKKNFDSPEQTMNPGEKIKVEVVTFGDKSVQRITTEPGWKWSEHAKPFFKTDSCQMHHTLYMLSGRVAARMNDGKELEFGPGDIGVIPPGHDGWTVGDEPAIWIEIPKK